MLLNQFPCENLLTVKDCLASIARRAGGPEGPAWLPRTFNLRTELPQFVSYFQQRERRGEDNHWICKPWSLARSLDTHITKSLHSVIRHRESSPKVGAGRRERGGGDSNVEGLRGWVLACQQGRSLGSQGSYRPALHPLPCQVCDRPGERRGLGHSHPRCLPSAPTLHHE